MFCRRPLRKQAPSSRRQTHPMNNPGDNAGRAAADAEAAAALRQNFLGAMRHAACTVSVVTTNGPAGRFGLTVSAMSSVSADGPTPTLLVCINHSSASADALLANGVFCVNVLRDDQAYVSESFARRSPPASGTDSAAAPDKFAVANWTTLITGAPRIVDPLVAFDCRVQSVERVGTHFVVVGAVAGVFVSPSGGAPLIYANRAYGTPQRLARQNTVPTATAGALSLGCVQNLAPALLPRLIAQMTAEQPQLGIALLEGDQHFVLGSLRSGEIDLAVLYERELPGDIAILAAAELDTYVLLPRDHRLAAQPAIALGDLAAEHLILHDLAPMREYCLALFRDSGRVPVVGYRTTSFEMVRGMVANGLGYSLLDTRPASDISYDGGALVTRPLAGAVARHRMVLAHRAGRALASAELAFAAHCREVFGEHRY